MSQETTSKISLKGSKEGLFITKRVGDGQLHTLDPLSHNPRSKSADKELLKRRALNKNRKKVNQAKHKAAKGK